MTDPEHPTARTRVRFWKEPLVHFLAAALLLFGLHAGLNGAPVRGPSDVVAISEGRVRQLEEGFRLLSQRAPTDQELVALVDDFVAEEIAYREAVALGLDADDTVVRRRMRQKLDFLMEESGAPAEPDDAELAAWVAAHPELYRAPELRAIQQVFASSDRRGARTGQTAQDWLAKLRSGADPAGLGDLSMLPAATPPTSHAGLSTLFGRAFADAVFSHPADTWTGPVASAFGAHLVRVTRIEPGRTADLASVRGRARVDWIEDKRRTVKREREALLRKRYRVDISWPEGRTPAALP